MFGRAVLVAGMAGLAGGMVIDASLKRIQVARAGGPDAGDSVVDFGEQRQPDRRESTAIRRPPPGGTTADPTPSPPRRTPSPSAAPTTPSPSAAPTTPAPTQEGVPCDCLLDECFNGYDLNKDGQLDGVECGKQAKLGLANCSSVEWDPDQDRLISRVEWHSIFENYSNAICPTRDQIEAVCCPTGEYIETVGECKKCMGEVRRRRAALCTDCPAGKFDGGDYDDCLGGIYLLHAVQRGSTRFQVSSAMDLSVGQNITITNLPEGEPCLALSACEWENPTITSIDDVYDRGSVRSQVSVGGRGLAFPYDKYSKIRVACSHTDGKDYSLAYTDGVCGCGCATCTTYEACDISLNDGTGGCSPLGPFPKHPTPSPTVGAKGDPHLVNLAGEHFDINHGGDFTLLRIPQSTSMPAEFELLATITSEYGKPCTTYITKVQLSGAWLGGTTVHARSYLRSHDKNIPDAQLGVRFVDVVGDTSWENIDTALDNDEVLSTPDQDIEVIAAKSQWAPRKRGEDGAPNLAGVFTLTLRHKHSTEAAKITIRQDLPDQEHLNLAVRKISALGRVDVGGLLGFDTHPDWLETVSGECNHHRATEKYRIESQDSQYEEPLYDRPKWMHKWDRVKEQRAKKAERGEDNDVVTASLVSNLMCKCSSAFDAEGEQQAEGVLVEEQVASMAEASWD